MALWLPPNSFNWKLWSTVARPGVAGYGTTITSGNNAFGSFSTLITGANLVADVWDIEIVVTNFAASAAARQGVLDIGIDPAGGTTFTTVIPNLLIYAAHTQLLGRVRYRFPLFIKAGSTIGARSYATTGANPSVAVCVQGRPSNPEVVKSGTYVLSYGVTAPAGVAVTPGTTSEGAWTQIVAATTKDHWWWQSGFSSSDTTMAGVTYFMDLGYGASGNQQAIFEDGWIRTDSLEGASFECPYQCTRVVPSGQTIWGRMQCSGTADTGLSMAAYGLGG